MCGIYITNIPFDESEVVTKLKSIEFRGPDNLGYKKIDDISMGHLRLSILDLEERSNQPMTFENYHIVFNGEIYNFLDIKKELIDLGHKFNTKSDTEVLLFGYREWGGDVVSKLNGMFAFAIFDTVSNKIFCARDRVGVKPFFYFWREGKFEICSQLRPLINPTSEISQEAISIYLDCGYVPSPFSILKDVFKLPPGNTLTIDLNCQTKEISEYWNLTPAVVNEITYDEAKEKLHELLIDAVKIRLQSDVSIGTFLSGGIDSALVSSIASKLSKNKINTFTIGFEDPKFDESKVAAEFASIIGSNHVETICKSDDALKMLEKLVEVYDEPFADSSALPSLLLNSVTKSHVTVALSGDGGDESFLGYNHFDALKKFNKIAYVPFFIRRFTALFYNENFTKIQPGTINSLLKTKSSDDYSWGIFTGFDSLQKEQNTNWTKLYNHFRTSSTNCFQRIADLNIKLWLENDSNVKVDRASMAYSVEVRSPFLDYRIIEFARTLPVSYRYEKGIKKRILKDILAEYIPEEVFNQPKKGFAIPLNQWIRKELKEEIISELSDDFLNKVANLDVSKFKKQFALHLDNKTDYTFNIWKLFVLAKWYKEFKM
ncbi:asparagine synthase (glutamine-hydrolyzing) [Flavobacterium sp. 2]|uniref:asparagine synthase (glutamine-hydrolyzing) n=1 Tax=Flavobacterium sp. 2 TaxID=308053 RepID=UPI000C1A779A|nr:asparagine synthase (glutamine-hydrolyzing) [Flavobacterium sp. 2]PIF59332.1 asparagine synthase (glutamine-hydrolysing) [Flavobacterium sp. 2]